MWFFRWWPRKKTERDDSPITALGDNDILIRQVFEMGNVTYKAYINHPGDDHLQFPWFWASGNTPTQALLNLIEHAKKFNFIIPILEEEYSEDN